MLGREINYLHYFVSFTAQPKLKLRQYKLRLEMKLTVQKTCLSHHTVKVRCPENHIIRLSRLLPCQENCKTRQACNLSSWEAETQDHKSSLSYTAKLQEEEEESEKKAMKAAAAAAKSLFRE